MRKKIVMLALLSGLLFGCGKGGSSAGGRISSDAGFEPDKTQSTSDSSTSSRSSDVAPLSEPLSMENINERISESRPTMINYLCSYTYSAPSVTLHDRSVLSIEYGVPIKGKYTRTHEKLNSIDADELISEETSVAYLKGEDYGIFQDGQIEWNRPYDSNFVLHNFTVDSTIFPDANIDQKSNSFSGHVKSGNESLFFSRAASVSDVSLDLKFDDKNRLAYLESTFLSEKKASVKVQCSYTYDFVSVTIPE